MNRPLVVLCVCLAGMAAVRNASAQSESNGSIRGYVKDEQGAVLPGVTLSAQSETVPGTRTAMSDDAGFYRLLDLPPGDYTVTAELQGFSKVARANIAVRAGLNLGVDIVMKVGAVSEIVTVKADTPMLETRNAVTAMNVSGDFQRAMPLSARRSWSDFLSLAPGVTSNNTIGATATNFFVNGATFSSHVIQLDGADIGGPSQSSAIYVIMSSEVLQDVQIKTAAVDASAPLGQGAVINMVTKSGTDDFKGSGLATYQHRQWHANNDPTGTTSSFSLVQPEVTFGGPIIRSRAWGFGSYRHTSLDIGIARTAAQLAGLRAIAPQYTPFNNETTGTQSLVKATVRLASNHQLQAFHQYGADTTWSLDTVDTVKSRQFTVGGHTAAGSVSSTWGRSLTTRIGFAFGNQTNFDTLTITDRPGRPVYQSVLPSGGRLLGTGQLAVLDNSGPGLSQDSLARKITATADLSYYTHGRLGSHEVQAGVYLQPVRRSDFVLHFANGGFATEEWVLRDSTNLASGIVPFRRQVYDVTTWTSRSIVTDDYAVYLQDAWKPSGRLTLGLGLRVDKIHRRDRVLGLDLQDTTAAGPRFGATYLVTSDGHNIVRTSWSRLHDAVSAGAGLSVASTFPGYTDYYDTNRDGIFEASFVTPANTPRISNLAIDLEHYRQPHANELTIGYTRQLRGQIAVDASVVRREFRDRQANIEVNGIYDGGIFRGYRDESFNNIFRLTSNSYNWPVYTAFEARVSKRSESFQMIGSYTRQFRHIAGTWQPNDPAFFIQPDSFPNDKGIGRVLDGITQNSLSGTDMTLSDHWKDHVLRLAGSYQVKGLLFSSSYTFQSGPWSGPVVNRVAAADPRFGPTTLTLSNGRVVSNPLSTLVRFAFPTRGEGQLRLRPAHTWNIRVVSRFSRGRVLIEPTIDILNVTNNDAFFAFRNGANQIYNTTAYGQGAARQPPREAQLSVRVRF